MKSHIMNLLALVMVAGCTTPHSPQRPAVSSNQQQVLVFSRHQKLEALVGDKTPPVILRQKFAAEPRSLPNWQMSRDGQKITFCATPEDEDFFDAGAYRDYLFMAPFNGKARVFLAGYGPKSVDQGARYDYKSSSFDQSGQKILVCEGQIGQFMDDPSPQWIAIYDLRTRRRVFDSRQLIAQFPQSALQRQFASQRYFSPALSPDGNDIVCVALPDDGNSVAENYIPGQKAPSFSIVHFDLKKQTAEILTSIDDQGFAPQFAWHPTQKRFVFSGPVAPTTPGHNLFNFDLATEKLTRLTSGDQDDFSPQWSLDGKSLWWLRGVKEGSQIYSAKADGTEEKLMFPSVKGAEKIQIVAKLGSWSRFKKIPIQPLAGRDK